LKQSISFLLSLFLFTSCLSDTDRLWYSAKDKQLRSGFYLCRVGGPHDPNGFTDPASKRELLPSRTTLVTLENVDTVFANSKNSEYPELTLRWSQKGAEKFAEFTSKCYGNSIAFMHEGKILSAPTVEGTIAGREVSIYGSYSSKFIKGLQDSVSAARVRDLTDRR
jgi:preprotein translocase subunit SecD